MNAPALVTHDLPAAKVPDSAAESATPIATPANTLVRTERLQSKSVRLEHVPRAKTPPFEIPPILLEGDEPSVWPIKPKSRRGELRALRAESKQKGRVLPETYFRGQLRLLARDPYCLYAHWDLPREQQLRYNALAADRHLMLRVFHADAYRQLASEVQLHPESEHWFVHVDCAGASYIAELGYPTTGGDWITILESNTVSTPANGPSTEPAIPAPVAAAITPGVPVSAPSRDVPDEATQPTVDRSQPAEMAATPHASTSKRESLPSVPGRAAPAPQLIATPALTFMAELPAGLGANNQASDRPPEWPPEPAAPMPTESAPAAMPPEPRGEASRESHRTIRGTAVAHTPHRPAPQLTPADLQLFQELLAIIEGEASVPAVTSQAVEEWIIPAGTPSSAELVRVRREKPPEFPSSVAVPELVAGLPASAALALPAPSPEWVRPFWFNVNAELIVYGATEPTARVSIGGRSIRLRPDGTFSYRFALPDGAYELPILAEADWGDRRHASMSFSRSTLYSGDVGAHPQESWLRIPAPENVD